MAAAGLVFYEPFHYIYLKHHFELMKADGVQHVELRQVFQKGIGNTYAANGTEFSPQHTVNHIVQAAAEVGVSVQIIYCMVRTILPEEVGAGLRAAEEMMQDYPGVVVGFDLVGQEDIGNPLSAYINQLLNATTPFFFHAGSNTAATSSNPATPPLCCNSAALVSQIYAAHLLLPSSASHHCLSLLFDYSCLHSHSYSHYHFAFASSRSAVTHSTISLAAAKSCISLDPLLLVIQSAAASLVMHQVRQTEPGEPPT